MPLTDSQVAPSSWLVHLAVSALLAVAVFAIFVGAPTESTMGDAQRIVYVHVAVAWLALVGLVVMAVAGAAYLVRRRLAWDHWFQAAAELGWLCCGLTLATGSLWAHEAWGTWWVWEPRLTSSFILWLIYSGVLMVRTGLDDPHRRARLGAVLAILGALDIPLVVMATRWFRGMHPESPEMAPAMRVTLLISVAGFSALFMLLAWRRRAQLRLQSLAERLWREAGP